jgi:uncharacterized protein YndB with AHSA1/START domain
MTDDPFELEFEIDAPREEVWRALVDPDALRGWFATEARVTPEVGGEMFFAHGDHGEASTVEEVVPHERFRAGSEGRAVEYVLEGRAGKTLLRIVHYGFGDEGVRDSLDRGWSQFMQTLRHYLAHHAHEPAACTYTYASAPITVEQAKRALPRTLPAGAAVVDDWPRSLGARVPVLGDGVYRASIEGEDGDVSVWVHLVAYGDGRERLHALTEELERTLAPALHAA